MSSANSESFTSSFPIWIPWSWEDPCPKGGSQEELPHGRGQGQWLRVPGCDFTGTAKRSYPASEVSGQSREELHRERRQGPRLGGPTSRPRSSGCVGTGGPRGAMPRWRSGRVVVRRYPSSKVRSSSWEYETIHRKLVNLITLGPQPCLTRWN